MKFTLTTLLTIVAAVSAASVDVGLIARQDNCASKGGKSPLPLTRSEHYASLTMTKAN